MADIRPAAVLTGDLIASRKRSGRIDEALAALEAAAGAFGAHHQMALRFTRFRGDGWQVVLTEPRLVLDATLFLLARLATAETRLSTRIAIGIGPVADMGTGSLADASGAAFETSGKALDTIGKDIIAIDGAGISLWQKAVFDLSGEIAQGWTAAQAEAVSLMLIPGFDTHLALAERLAVSRQAVQSRLASAGFSALSKARAAFEVHDFDGGAR